MTNCFWSQFEPGSIAFCEERLCSWIAEPANTWSNIGYLLVGLYLARQAWRQGHSPINFFSVTSIYLFFGSSLFHATGTFWGEVLDLSAMFLLSACMLALNLKRFLHLNQKQTTLTYVGVVAVSILILLIYKPSGIPVFALQGIIALSLEYRLFKKRDRLPDGSPLSYKDFKLGVIAFAVAFFFWILDFTHVACIPQNHILTGHAIWHLTNALTIYFLARFYRPYLMSPSANA